MLHLLAGAGAGRGAGRIGPRQGVCLFVFFLKMKLFSQQLSLQQNTFK